MFTTQDLSASYQGFHEISTTHELQPKKVFKSSTWNSSFKEQDEVWVILQKPKNPVDTRCKLNVHKTFRRRPGGLLNVLCTINLRPVSTGKEEVEFSELNFIRDFRMHLSFSVVLSLE